MLTKFLKAVPVGTTAFFQKDSICLGFGNQIDTYGSKGKYFPLSCAVGQHSQTAYSRSMMKPERPERGVTIYGSEGTIELNRNFFNGIRRDESLHSEINDASITTMLYHLGNFA
ncbi:MAG: hypothetical protein R2819_01250 [Allomuricauda sp.]